MKELISKKVKLMFIYPNTRPIFRQGIVLEVYHDCFKFKDRYDGDMEFGYAYLESIEEKNE